MDLERVIAALAPRDVVGRAPLDVADLAYDTRAITPGALFFCVRGANVDGHELAAQAVEAGATAHLVYAILAAAGRRPGLLGTIEARLAGERRPVVRTTPEAIDLQRTFREMLDAGDRSCAMEASSHAAARLLGIDDAATARGIETLRGVPGRFESVDEGQPFEVIVDYSHTPDSLENALRAARELAAGRVLCVFGCGGDRDREKRPLMGRVAAELADVPILTSDNPRSEDPLAIIAEVLTGATGEVEV